MARRKIIKSGRERFQVQIIVEIEKTIETIIKLSGVKAIAQALKKCVQQFLVLGHF